MFTKTKKWLIAALAALAIIALSVCGALNFTSASADDEIDWDSVEATEVDEASDLSALVSGTKYKLTADIALESSLTIAANTSIYLDLNGYTLSLATGYATTSVITVNGNLTLADSNSSGNGKGIVTGGFTENETLSSTDLGGGVYVASGASFTMLGGTISGNKAYSGGGVYVDGGTLVLKNSTITNNTITYTSEGAAAAIYGGGVYASESDVTITDSTISNNAISLGVTYSGTINVSYTATSGGGGIYAKTCTLTIDGSSVISNNTVVTAITYSSTGKNTGAVSAYGGGLYLSGGTGNVSGTTSISANTITATTDYSSTPNQNGGGVYVAGTFTMEDGTISNNTSYSGGGVYVSTGAIFTMNGGTICGHYAFAGGGVYTVETGSFIMNGGTISDNSATQGGGVYVGLVMAMNDGEIINNTATDDYTGSTATCMGGGIYLSSVHSVLHLYGGTISGNTVEAGEDACGGGIYSKRNSIIAHGSPVVTGNTVGTTTNNIEFKYSGLSVILDGNLNSAASLGITAKGDGLVAKTEGYTVSGTISSDTTTAFNKNSRGYYYGSATGDAQSSSNVASITIGSTTYYYNSLAEAIRSNLADEYTVNILKDIELDEIIFFPAYSKVTLNTEVSGGVTVTYPNVSSHWFYIPKNAEAVVTGNIIFDGGGESSSSSYYLFYNYGSLTLGSIDATYNPTVQNFYSTSYGVIFTDDSFVYDEDYKVVVHENEADYQGTNKYYYCGGTLTINGGLYTGNVGSGSGSVVYSDIGAYTYVNGGSFTNNQAKNGGAMYIYSSTLTITAGEFTNNTATASGGAICLNATGWKSTLIVTGGYFGTTKENEESADPVNTYYNQAATNGGAIYAGAYNDGTISNAVFAYNRTTNSSKTYGGAIFIQAPQTVNNKTITITDCIFHDNGYYVNDDQETVVTVYGGAISASSYTNTIVTNCTFFGNKATNGGALHSHQYSTLTVNGGTFENNEATTGSGGAIYYYTAGVVTINGGTFIENSAGTAGGAIYVQNGSGTITVNGSYFGTTATNEELDTPLTTLGNAAGTNGGAIYGAKEVTISNAIFANNEAATSGGAVCYATSSTISVKNSTFRNNSATVASNTSGGGAIWAGSNSTLIVEDCTFEYNTAKGSSSNQGGGAIWIRGNTTTISNSTFKGNSATTGGAFYNFSGTSVTLNNNTFINNGSNGEITTNNGGAIYSNGTLTINGGYFGTTEANEASSEPVETLGNSATNGGAIRSSGTLTINGCVVKYNTAATGGGVYSSGTTNISEKIIVTDNTTSNLYLTVKINFADNLTTGSEIGVTLSGKTGQFTATETNTKYYIYSAQYIHSDDTTYNVVANSGYLSLSDAAIHTISYYEDTEDETPEVQINVLVSNNTYTVDFTLFTKSGSYVSSYNTSKEGDGDTYNSTSSKITLTSGGEANLWVVESSWTKSNYTVTPATLTFSGTYGYDSIAGQTVEATDTTITTSSITYDEDYVSITVESGVITIAPVTELSAGTYETTITVKTSDTATFEIAVTINIAKAALTDVTETNYTGTYDGNAYSGSVTAETVDGSSVTYAYSTTNDGTYDLSEIPSYTNAGTYTVYYQITAENHETKTGSVTISIAKADISSATIKVSGSYAYTGAEQAVTYSVSLSGFSSSELTYEVTSGATGTNAGEYTLTLTGSGNFTGIATKSWTISKATYDLSGLTMSSDSVVYDGASHTIEIEGTLPTGASATYTSYKNVGTYTVTATISGNSNYEDATMTATLTIENATLKSSEATGYSGSYDGKAHTGSVTATTVDGSAATIMYGTTKGNYTLSEMPSYTDAGTYTVYYQITAANHKTRTGSIEIIINSVVTKDLTNSDVEGEVTSDSFAVNEVSYTIKKVDEADYDMSESRIIANVVKHVDEAENAEVVAVYDISLTSDGQAITVSEATNGGKVTITVALPEELANVDTFYIVHIHNGTLRQIITRSSYTVEDGYVTFTTSTLSQFAFVIPTEATTEGGSSSGGSSSGGSTEGGSSSGGSTEGGSTSGGSTEGGSTEGGSSSVDSGTTDIGGTDDGNNTLLIAVLVTGGVIIVLAVIAIVVVFVKKKKV